MKHYDFQNPSQKASIFPTEGFFLYMGQDRISWGLTAMVGKQGERNRCLWGRTHLPLNLAAEQRATPVINTEVAERAAGSSAKWPLWIAEPASLKTALYLEQYSKRSLPSTPCLFSSQLGSPACHICVQLLS